jgi:hypothetical protein
VSDSKSSDSGFDLEQFINLLAQKLFPRWYARHAVKEIELTNIEAINPESYLCHRWLSIVSVHQAAAESLLSTHQKWHPLAELLKKALIENEYPRKLSITAIKGVKISQCDEDFPDLLSYAKQQADQIPHETEEDFNNNIEQAFPLQEEPIHVCYREWDGRYYLMNEEEPRHLGALILQCNNKQKNHNLACNIHVESIQGHTLDRIRAGYWILLMKREDAYRLYQLLKPAKLSCEIAEFEWRRSDLVFFIATKTHPVMNQILLSLLSKHSSKQIIDWGRFLSRSNFPFHNQ